METNFDYLLKKEEYADFAKQAVEAEKKFIHFTGHLCHFVEACT